MHYWSEIDGASVFVNNDKIGQVENSVIDPANKAVLGFLLERRSTELRHRFIPFSLVKELRRDSIKLRNTSGIIVMTRNFLKNNILAEELLNKPIIDENGEWIGRVVDFAFDASNGNFREIILSGSLIEDIWLGRKRMPVLERVEFSRELIQIDRDTRNEITGLKKGLKNLLNMDIL